MNDAPWISRADLEGLEKCCQRLTTIIHNLDALGASLASYQLDYTRECIQRVLPRLRYELTQDTAPPQDDLSFNGHSSAEVVS